MPDIVPVVPAIAVPSLDENEQQLLDLFNGSNNTMMSFSGCDIQIQAFGNGRLKTFAELQTFSYSVHREKIPVRTLGRSNPKGYTRGTRTIAGSMIFTVFDRNALWQFLEQNRNDMPDTPGHSPLTDEIAPFDVTVTFQNELGVMASMRIYGLEIVDEGKTMSIDDILTESIVSYVARDMTVMSPRGMEFGPDGKTFVNQGIFFADTPNEDLAMLVYRQLKQIWELEKELLTTTNAGERASLQQKIDAIRKQITNTSKMSYAVERAKLSDPIGPYASPWSYLDLR